VLLAAADVALTILAFEAAYQTRVYLPLEQVFFLAPPVKALLLGFVLVLWIALGRWFGIYARLYGSDTRSAVVDAVRQVFFGGLGLVMFIFFLRFETNISRTFIALFLSYDLLLLIVYRASAGRLRGWMRRELGAESFFVVVGSGPRLLKLASQLEEARQYGARLAAIVDLDEALERPLPLKGDYPLRRLDELKAMLRNHVVDEVLFSVDLGRLGSLEEIFLLCDEEGVRTRVAADLFPHVNSRMFLDKFGDRPMLTFSATPHDEPRLLAKRLFDIVVSAAALAALALPMLIVALLIRITSKGPALFSQMRCGLNGRLFSFYKFRSMVAEADAMRAELEHLNEKDGPVFKIKDDPRLTWLGRYLRRFSIDELPQFWNILRGDMSFVGPRPAIRSEVEQYETWQRRRLRMRPGLTCLWALSGRDEVDFETWMKLDLEYIDKWSLWLDLKILLRSIPLVLAGRGAH